MTEPLGPLTTRWLKCCGYSDAQIAGFNNETRLFHDLDLYGDNALDELEFLANDFGVDFSDFHFDRYFPGNFGRDPFVLTLFKPSRFAAAIREKYPPVTMDMIEKTITQKKWTFG
jgi:hypothetical protein